MPRLDSNALGPVKTKQLADCMVCNPQNNPMVTKRLVVVINATQNDLVHTERILGSFGLDFLSHVDMMARRRGGFIVVIVGQGRVLRRLMWAAWLVCQSAQDFSIPYRRHPP